jgi:hypothetical protein
VTQLRCTLKSVGEVRPRQPSANHDPGQTPSAGVVLIPDPVRPQHPRDLEPRELTRVDALGHVIPDVLDRCPVQLRMPGRIAGQLHQLGEDITARAGAFVGHNTTADAIETVFPRRNSKDAAAMPGLVRHQSLKAAPPSVGPLDRAWDRIPIHEGPTRGSIRPQIERRFGFSEPKRFYGEATGRRATRAVRLTNVLREGSRGR